MIITKEIHSMTMRREDIANMDFSDIVTGERLPLATPGDLLHQEFMGPLGLSANALAHALHVPANRITAILNGTRGITADTALRLARYFGTTPEFWMGMQTDYDLRKAMRDKIERIKHDVTPRAA